MNHLPNVRALTAEETVFRRLPEAWKDLPRVAFLPHEVADVDGLSLSRETIGAQGTAATGASGKTYYVAGSNSRRDRRIPGLMVLADTDSHAVIRELNSQLRRSKNAADKNKRDESARLLQLLFRNQPIQGPYTGKR